MSDEVGCAEAEVGRYVYRLIEARMDAKPGTPEATELEYLSAIVSDVEEYGAHDLMSDDDLRAAPASPILSKDHDELRLAICGGEDVPGYNATLSHAEIMGVLRDNYGSWRAATDLALAAKAQVEALEARLRVQFKGAADAINIAEAEIDRAEAMRRALEKIEAAGTVVYNGESFTNEQANLAAIALSAPVEERGKGDTPRVALDETSLLRVIHAAHKSAPYPWWHVEAEHCRVSPHIAKAVLAALASSTPESSEQPLLDRLQHAPTVFGLINRCCFVTEDGRHALVIDTAKFMAEVRALATPAEARSEQAEGEA